MNKNLINKFALMKIALLHPNWLISFFKTGSLSDIPKRYIYKLLPRNPIIIEAGVADGTDTIKFANKFKFGKIFGFEPLPSLYEIAKIKTKNFDNVNLYQLALGKEDNEVKKLFTGRFDSPHQSSSLLKPKQHLNFFPDINFVDVLDVETITLRKFINDQNLEVVDLLWLDLQGLEIDVLARDLEVLKLIRYIHLEVHVVELYEGAPLLEEVLRFMKNNNFSCIKKRISPISGNMIFQNNTKN